jgi:hypothetical protein
LFYGIAVTIIPPKDIVAIEGLATLFKMILEPLSSLISADLHASSSSTSDSAEEEFEQNEKAVDKWDVPSLAMRRSTTMSEIPPISIKTTTTVADSEHDGLLKDIQPQPVQNSSYSWEETCYQNWITNL